MSERKVALVGTAPSGRHAPFNDPSWEIWGVGLRADYVTRVTRWFELHRLDGEPPQWAAEWRRLMNVWTDECEVWMFYPEADLGPKIVHFDYGPLAKKYGTFFMTSSFAWMLALAIEEKVDEIGIWGVDMEYGTEYRQQRAGLRHFMATARLLGIKTKLIASSGISYEPVPYPFWQDDPMLAKVHLRKKQFEEFKIGANFAAEKMQMQLLRQEGALKALNELAEGEDLKKRTAKLAEEIEETRRGMLVARDDLRRAEGALDELKWLEDYLQP